MSAPPVRSRVYERSIARFGDSVFKSQVLLTGAVGLAVCITVGFEDRELQDGASFFFGLTAILWITILSAIIPWSRFAVAWQAAIPLMDIAAITTLRLAEPQSGFGILLIFPVIWLATTFGARGGLVGVLLASGLLWSQVGLSQLDINWLPLTTITPAATASLSAALAFVAVVTYTTTRRVDSQRVLLRRQTHMLEKALHRTRVQEQTVREAFDAVEFAVLSLDTSGKILTANRATRSLLAQLGLPHNTPWNRFPLYRADKTTPLTTEEMPHVRVLSGATIDSQTYCIGHLTGTRFTIDLSARLVHNTHGEVDRVVIVLRDVSAEVRAITDRDDLVTSMSHELRTPLSSVLGYIDLALEADDLPESARDMLDIALASTQRVNSLVTDLLAARSTSPSTATSLKLHDCDLLALVSESINAVRVLAGDRLIVIALESDPEVTAMVDAFRLRQVVDNLLSNAIKYNRIGGRITVSIRHLAANDGPAMVQIQIADNGRGMTVEEQKGLFERFYRAESVRGSTVHGTGLGLSISREIVERHGGTIEVASEAGVGTEVLVTLPVTASKAISSSTPAPLPEEN